MWTFFKGNIKISTDNKEKSLLRELYNQNTQKDSFGVYVRFILLSF